MTRTEHSTKADRMCRQCRGTIQLGEDVTQIVTGVIGPRGIVNLDEPTVFCCETCLRGYISGTDEQISKPPRRIP